MSNKETKSWDKQCVTTILVNNSSQGDPRLPPSISQRPLPVAKWMTNGWKHKIIDIKMITRHWEREGDYCYERILWIFLHFFPSGNVMMMMAGNHRVPSLSPKYSNPRNIPGTGDFLFGFYPTPKHFKLRPFISDWERRDVAVSKSYRGLSRRYSLKTVHLKYFASRGLPPESFPGLYFTVTSRVIFYFLPRVMNTLDVIYRWNV